MSGSFQGFGSRPGAQGSGLPSSFWDAMEQLKDTFERSFSPRVAKGDVRAAVLAILAESRGNKALAACASAKLPRSWRQYRPPALG